MALAATSTNFEQEVIAESQKRPVLVDFWAEWCGPCRMLGPVLDKLEADYDGRFRLAKVDTDAEQNLALRYRVSGIPDVKLFYKGEVLDGFTGAMPEPAVRRFLDANLPDPALETILELADSDPLAAADELIAKNIQRPATEDIIWRGTRALLQKDGSAETVIRARNFLEALSEVGGPYSDLRGRLLGFLERYGDGGEELDRLRELLGGQESPALDYFLGRVEAANGDERKARQEDMLVCFFVLGNQHPLVNEYRRKLSAVLY